MRKGKSSEAHIKSVLKTLAVLEQFIENNNEKGIYELSLNSGIPASTMQRLVNTLESKGYLMQNPKTRKYRLGLTMYHLYKSFANTFNWVDEAKQYMEQLVQKHNETINLAYLEGMNIVYLTKVDSKHILRPSFNIGTRYPAYCTSLGKCLIAYQPTAFIKKVALNTDRKKLTDKTKISDEEFLNELSTIRKQNYAIDDEEFQNDLRCIAVPISNTEGIVVAAMSISAPSNRIDVAKMLVIKEDMFKVAKEISMLID